LALSCPVPPKLKCLAGIRDAIRRLTLPSLDSLRPVALSELQRELKAVHREQVERRHHREGLPKVAIVGYTNAGKSSVMRALTASEVLVADQLFATLDTTVRALQPETQPRILVSDTVGFIRNLPHDLVASFRSTLDEALDASLLLHIVDAGDPALPSHIQVTKEVRPLTAMSPLQYQKQLRGCKGRGNGCSWMRWTPQAQRTKSAMRALANSIANTAACLVNRQGEISRHFDSGTSSLPMSPDEWRLTVRHNF
jgi:tRNA U34 5-carboxymethylaminomethyl modifying GTPase MnmE/TrmE